MNAIHEKYMSFGGESVIGRPLHGERPTPDGRGRYQTFAGSKIRGPVSIHWSPETGAHVTYGAIRSSWERQRWEKGRLGYPTSDEADYDENGVKGRISHFQGGALVWNEMTGKVATYTRDSEGTLREDSNGSKSKLENAAIGATVVGGSTAAVIGGIAAASATTGAISAAGAVIGGVAGGITGGLVGSGIGIASCGTAIAGTVPLAAGGAALGSSCGALAGPALALFGIGTAPVWAVPAAIAGGVLAVGGLAIGLYKFFKPK